MSMLPASADLKARVARLQPCDCKRNWTEPHLTIEWDHIPLQNGEATAISYVWGEFDRRDVPVGHPPGKSDDVVCVNLGIEWVTQDVIHRLAEIATDKPIWMDQLCIPQNDEEIRRVLASIATIYKTFDVAVLLPGHPCACLPRIVKELEERAAKERRDHTPERNDDVEDDWSNFCLNICPLSSWMSRLWTFQELGFSQNVRCVWVSKDVAKCIFSCSMPAEISKPEDLRLCKSIAETDLQPYAAIWFRRTISAYVEAGMEELRAVNKAWSYLRSLSFEFLMQIHSEIPTFEEARIRTHWITSIRAFEHVRLYQFLYGEVIQKYKDPFLELHPWFKLFERLPLLWRSVTISRKATHVRDYVIAIFAEVRGYSPPPNYRNEEVPMLLQHAVDWHRRESNNFVILSTAPQGLFMPDAAESFLWRPAYYLSPDNVRTANDVYQTLVFSMVQPVKVKEYDVILLSYRIAGCIPLSAAAKGWESFHGDFAEPVSVPDIAAQLRNTIRGWESHCTMHIRSTFNEEVAKYASGESVPNAILRLRCCFHLLEQKDIPKDYLGRPFSTTEIHLAFYELVCRALRLDAAFCWEKGVKLMFSPPTESRQHTRVGLCRGDVKLGGEQGHDSDQIMAHQSLTIGFGPIQFEAEKIDDHEGKPAYRVFGIWVEMEDDFEDDIGAVHDDENLEAFLL